jgi:hypothetical protein
VLLDHKQKGGNFPTARTIAAIMRRAKVRHHKSTVAVITANSLLAHVTVDLLSKV